MRFTEGQLDAITGRAMRAGDKALDGPAQGAEFGDGQADWLADANRSRAAFDREVRTVAEQLGGTVTDYWTGIQARQAEHDQDREIPMQLTSEQLDAITDRANIVADQAMPKPEHYGPGELTGAAYEQEWDRAEAIAQKAFNAEMDTAMSEIGATREDYWTAIETRQAQRDAELDRQAAELDRQAAQDGIELDCPF